MCKFTLFYFIGQVGGLASASAVFQSRLDTELHERLPPNSEEVYLLQVMNFSRIDFFSPPPSAYQKNPPFSTTSRQPAYRSSTSGQRFVRV